MMSRWTRFNASECRRRSVRFHCYRMVVACNIISTMFGPFAMESPSPAMREFSLRNFKNSWKLRLAELTGAINRNCPSWVPMRENLCEEAAMNALRKNIQAPMLTPQDFVQELL